MQPILADGRVLYLAVLSALLCFPGLCDAATMASKPEPAHDGQGVTSAPEHWKVLNRYCETCHNTEDWAGGVAFDALDAATIPQDEQTWEKVIRKLQAGMMPPPGKPRPQRRVLDSFATELASRLDEAQAKRPVASNVPVHRLNRTEYANAIRDLLAFDVDVATLLPADDAADGFDNVADVLNVSPTLVQAYVSAAMKISRWAVGDRSTPPTSVKYVVPAGLSQEEHIEGLPLGTRGGMTVTHNFPLDAEYEFRVSAGSGFRFAGPVGGPPPRVDVMLDGQQVNEPDVRKFRIRVKAGPRKIGVALVEQRHWAGVDGLYSKAQPRRDDLESVTINGPFNPTGPGDTPSRRAIFLCHPKEALEEEACARTILTHLAGRGLRRPVRAGDPALDLLLSFYRAGRQSGDFEDGIRTALARLLVEPRFLYRIEAPVPELAAGTLHKIDDIDLASRLSFFLWSSIPDEELIDLGAAGHLGESQVIQQQVRRMLADPRSQALVDNFAGQWLRLRELRGVQPADPQFDENLREALRQETLMLFANIMRADRSVLELLDADYTFVNERLARHYGIANVHGSFMRRVNLPHDSPRRGLLGQGSILTVTSAGNRTSPVQRGAWVMEALFGAAVPQPPPGVDQSLKEDPTLARPMTVRERLELHRANPNCAACHQIMDPIGFSLEHFDLDGRWRDLDGTTPIDSSGKLVDGTALAGVNDLRRALLARSDSFVTSMIEKMLMYALGRRIQSYDQPAIRKILRDARRENYRFSAIVLGIAQSIPFRMTGAAPQALAPGGLREAGLNPLQSTHTQP
jgi:mono/diheme cytochrome c family protein